MSDKNSRDNERKPDLSIPDQEIIEEKVKAMFESEEKDTKVEEAGVADNSPKGENEPLSAPTLPQENKPNKIKIDVQEHSQETVDKVEEELIDEDADKSEENEDTAKADDKNEDNQSEAEELLDDGIDEESEDKYIDEIQKDEDKEDLDEQEGDKEDEQEDINNSENKPEEIQVPKKQPKSNVGTVINDVKTSKAVDDIVAKEADDLLDLEDKKNSTDQVKPKKSRPNIIKRWWLNKKARYLTIVIILLLVISLFIVPTTRNKILNSVGVKAKVSVVINDSSTGQPLKNVIVKIDQSEAKTDSSGQASLSNISLGEQKLIVSKRAFADNVVDVKIGLGSNQVPSISLNPTGVQYSFVVVDYVSKKPLSGIEANFQEASGLSNEDGKIKLTLEDSQDLQNIDLTFDKSGYRQEKLTINADDRSEKNVEVVVARKHIYVSNRDGKYSVFSSYIDSKDEQKIVTGTGNERDDIDLKLNPNDSVAAYVSTKSGNVNEDNFKLSTLTIVDADNSQSEDIVDAERIQLIGWIDDTLVYVQGSSGGSEQKPDRHKLFTYNYKTKETKEISKSNYFNDVVIAQKKIYYAPSGALQPEQAKLFRVNQQGEEKTEVAQIEIFKIFRADYDNLVLSANQNWLNLRLNENKVTSISAPPSNPKSRIYNDSPDGKSSLWVDTRDGKGVLVNYQTDSRNELNVASQKGLINPVYWLDDKTVIFRVSNQVETADYIVSTEGGEPKKVVDVANANAVDNWYYY